MPTPRNDRSKAILESVKVLEIGKMIPFLLHDEQERQAAYEAARSLGIEISIRKHLFKKKAFEATRVK